MRDLFKKFKKYVIVTGIYLGLLILLSFFNVLGLPSVISSIVVMIMGIVLLFYLGFIKGFKRKNKGYLAGLMYGSITIVIMFLLSILIFRSRLNVMMFVYYGILLLSCVIGSMLGINSKKDN